VIWDHVGYFSGHEDKLNTFQVIIVDQGTSGIDLVFNYDSITWETGDLSGGVNGFGGTSAIAGYAAGDGDSTHALILPGSFANGGLLDSNPATSLAGHSTAGEPAGRYLFQVREGEQTGGRVSGKVTDPDANAVDGALVQVCPETGGGACVTRIADAGGNYRASNLAAGNYTVTGFPGSGDAFSSTSYSGVAVGGPGTTTTRDIVLGPEPTPPPEGTTIGPRIDDDPDGVPSAYWGDPLDITTQGCPNGTAHYTVELEGQIVKQGDLTETPPGSGTFTGRIPALMPDHGAGEIRIHFSNCGASPADDVDFGIYIDPSGVVRDTAGNPVPGAQVTLYRSASPDGPFFAVPDESPVMSPSNRNNPDFADDNGHFGWDVVAGYYVVKAENGDDCTGQSGVLSIPPPVTDLDIRLSCAPSPPPPAAGPVLVGNPPPATPAATPRRLARLGKVRLIKGKTLAVKVTCAKSAKKACAGKVALKIGKKPAGSRSFKKLKPGRSATVKVKLTKKGRKLVRKVRHGKKVKIGLRITVRDAAGKGATVSRTVKLKR
jgi:hypothetical protein